MKPSVVEPTPGSAASAAGHPVGSADDGDRYRHPVNRALEHNQPRSQRIADAVTNFMGSWTFIVIQTAIVATWVAGNLYLVFNFDPYPFIFLNLAFSTQAAYAAPLILLASNRAAVRDRMTLEHAAAQTDVEESQNERLLRGSSQVLHHVEAVEQQILGLEQRILQMEQSIMNLIEARVTAATDGPAGPTSGQPSTPASPVVGPSAAAGGDIA
jgi:uncharacterized membrane protein